MKVEFREPPKADSYTRVDHHELAARLKEKPGEWAVIPREYANDNTARSVASWIRAGTSLAYRPKGAFEAIARKEDGVTHVWVRFVGTVAQQAA